VVTVASTGRRPCQPGERRVQRPDDTLEKGPAPPRAVLQLIAVKLRSFNSPKIASWHLLTTIARYQSDISTDI